MPRTDDRLVEKVLEVCIRVENYEKEGRTQVH